ncbi:MAG: carboxypeptidase-like regulatory domain-containing protein [Longimicrobiales bacterium]
MAAKRRTICNSFALAFAILVLPPASSADARQTGVLSGTVVDNETLEPVTDAVVIVRGTLFRTATDAGGAFRFEGLPAGEQQLVLQHIAYGEHTESVTVRAREHMRLRIRIAQNAILLEPVLVEAQTELERRREQDGHGVSEILRPAIDDAARRGLDLGQLLRDRMPGIRVRSNASGSSTCVEYRGGASSGRTCREVTVVVDGVLITAPSTIYGTIPLATIERLEILSPGQAGTQFGAAANYGVLLIETRTGPRPERRAERSLPLSGFDWSEEPSPYRWFRVVGSSFLGNAIGLGVGHLIADQCIDTSRSGFPGIRTRCGPISTTVAGVISLALPALAGSAAARWAGGTERSQGRLLPSSAIASLAVAAGFLLLVEGEGHRSDVTKTAGTVVLVAGTPALLTLADRVFRSLR